MASNLPVLKLFPLAVFLFLAGCSGSTDGGAYILNAGEFNRNSPNFAKTPQDIDSVTICYNKYGTKPENVATMAKQECARFNKKAVFLRQSFNKCPLFTPVAAIFNCQNGN